MRIVHPDPPLGDDTIRLRPWITEDVEAIVAACNEDEIVRWLDTIPHPYTTADGAAYVASCEEAWREERAATFAVVDAAADTVVGSVSMRLLSRDDAVAEVGYWIARDVRGRGIATRALALLATWAIRDVGIERLQLRAEARNVASQRVAERAGFRREGVLRSSQWLPRQNRRADWVMFSLLPADVS